MFLLLFASQQCLIIANSCKIKGKQTRGHLREMERRTKEKEAKNKKGGDEGGGGDGESLWNKYLWLWIILIVLGSFLLILFLTRTFGKRSDPTVAVDETIQHVRRRLRSSVSGMLLSRKLHSEIRKQRKLGLRGIRREGDLYTPETRRRFFRVYETLCHHVLRAHADRKLFATRFPKMLKFYVHKAKEIKPRSLGLRSMFGTMEEYFKRFEHIDLRKNKMQAMMGLSKVIYRTPTIVRTFNSG